MPALREAFLILPNGRRVALTKERVTVGRTGSKCDVIIDDASVSRNHAILHWDGERWTVTDMGARNKTFVDEKPLEPNAPAPLRDGCTVHFGFYATRFGLGAEVADDAAGKTMDFNVAQAMKDAEARQRSAAATIPDAGPAGEVFATLQLHSVTNATTYRITHELVTIGTDAASCEVAIIDSMASPRHAELRFVKGNRVLIKKVGSSTLRVNNRMVNEVVLTTGDEIGIGESKFTFRLVKFPENLTIKESASSKVARLVVGSLVIVLGVGGWYAWKVLGPQGSDAEAEIRRIEREQVTEARRYTPESILDLVTTRRYDEAIEDATKMVEEGISADVVARWPGDIRNLREATAARSRGEAGPAFMALSKINPSSEVLSVASREATDIRQRYQDWLAETRAAVEQAEKRADWARATGLLDELVQYHEPERAYYEGVRQRIGLRRDARAVYDEVLEAVAEDPAAALATAQEALQRVRTEGAGLPDAENAFREPLLELADAEAHAKFLLAYNGFTGDLSPFEEFASVPRASYPARKSIDDGLARLRQVAAIQERINEAVAALPRNAPPSREIFAQMDSIVAMYDELLAVEDDNDFGLARAAAAGIEEVNNTKRSEIFKRAAVQVTVDESLEGDQRILQEALAQRRKWFRILELYPAEAILNEGREDDLRVLLRDPDLFAEFKNARQEYNATLSTINGVMLTAAINRDQAILAQRTEVFQLLDETTIDIDTFGRDRVENLRSRLNEMLGPE